MKTLLACTVLLMPTPLLAQAPASDPAIIVVTANRGPTPLGSVGQSVAVLDRTALTTLQTVAVVDALRLVPGVTVARNGGVGGFGGVFIRGADSEQTAALIDGVKINDPASPGGGFDFGTLLLGNIDRIEVVRGSQSVLWGSQAIGGVVNMITAAPTDEPTANASAEYGWRNTGQLVGNASGRVGPVAASIGGGWFRSDGVSAFSEDRGGRERDGFENVAANGRLLIDLGSAASVDFRGFYTDGRIDSDGFAPPAFQFGDTPEVSRSRQFVGYSGLNLALFDGRLKNRLAFAYTSIDRENRDEADAPEPNFEALGRNERFEYQGIAAIAPWLGATFGLERELSRLTTRGFGATSRARARLDSIYAQLELRPLKGLSVNAGVRHDDHDQFGGNTVLAANGSYSPNGGATVVRASYGEGFKVPSLFQLFSDFGNEALQPERSHSLDAGIAQRLLDGAFELSATLFRRTVTNQILFVSCFGLVSPICEGRPFGTYDNVASARAEGVELSLRMQPTDRLALSAGYALVDAVNRATGRQLPRRAQDSLNAQIDWQTPIGLALGATAHVVGASFDDAANANRLPGYALVDLRAAWAIGRGLELFGRVENLFNERYETVRLYGAPGRAGHAGLRWRL